MPHDFNKYHFKGQHDGEVIEQIIHRHWFNILVHFLIVIILAFLLLVSFVALPVFFPTFFDEAGVRFFLFIENTSLLFIWIYGFLVWIDYYFDVWIITNERIVNIEQKGLFVRHVSELDFSRVQDVTCTVEGLIPTVLNFGNVHVQTAGEKVRFAFRNVPDPYAIKDAVMRLSQQSLDNDLRLAVGAIQRHT